MAITVQTIIDDVRKTLQDDDATRWSNANLVDYLNEGVHQIALVRPDATAKTSSVQLVAGTRQTLPADGLRLLKVSRNMGSTGTTAGPPVKRADEQTLAMFKPDWHSQTGAAAIKNYVYDDRDPKTWWCEPPVTGTVYVEVVYSSVPALMTIGALSANIPIDDVYEAPLKQWMWHRAFGVEISSLTSQQLSAFYLRQFYQSLGIKFKGDVVASPNPPNAQQVAGAS